MKYIVFQTRILSGVPRRDIVLFSDLIVHSIMAQSGTRALQESLNSPDVKPISAGFADSQGNCFGQSESLKLKSIPEDDTMLLRNGDAVAFIFEEIL